MRNSLIRLLIIIVALGAAAIAEAQQPKKVLRIGFVSAGSPQTEGASGPVRIEALRQGLRELGWIEGKNLVIEARWGEGKLGRSVALAAELVQLKVDVIVVSGGIRATREIKTIPVVFVGTNDPVSTGLVASLARPGGNVTGLTSLAPELVGKRLELLKETFPKISRLAFLVNPAEPSNMFELEHLRRPAAALGVTLRAFEARDPEDIEQAFSMMLRERVEGFFTGAGALTNTNQRRIVKLAAKSRLPAIYHTSQFVDGGGLMSYRPNLAEMFRRAAHFVDRILKGAKPADLPVERPTKFELVINLKTAKALGVKSPAHLLMEADKVIE